jgi:hypothetical protein
MEIIVTLTSDVRLSGSIPTPCHCLEGSVGKVLLDNLELASDTSFDNANRHCYQLLKIDGVGK